MIFVLYFTYITTYYPRGSGNSVFLNKKREKNRGNGIEYVFDVQVTVCHDKIL